MQDKKEFIKTTTRMSALILTDLEEKGKATSSGVQVRGEDAFVAQSVLRAALIMMVIHMVSRMLGMVREVLLTKHFGAGVETDAFFTAELFCVFFPMLFGESLSVILVTIFSEYKAKKDESEAWKITSYVTNLSLLVMVAAAVGLYFSAPYILPLMYSFDQTTLHYALTLISYMLPIVIFVVMMEIAMGVFEAHHSFTIPSTGFLFINTFIVTGIILLDGLFDLGIRGAAVGYTSGVLFAAAFFWLVLWKKTKAYSPSISLSHPGVRKVAWLVLPMFLSKCAGIVLSVVDQLFGSALESGSISALSYGFMLFFVVPSLFMLALQKAFFPSLSDHIHAGEKEEASDLFQRVIELLSFLLIPVSIFSFLFAEPLVRVVFERGEFNVWATEMTAAALRFYCVGMVFGVMGEFIRAVFFAYQNTRLVMVAQIVMILLNTGLNALLIGYYEIAGLALASSISCIVITLALLYYLHKKYMPIKMFQFFGGLAAMGVLALIGNLACWWSFGWIEGQYNPTGALEVLLAIIVAFIPGALFYVIMGFVCRLHATELIWEIMNERILAKFSFWRNRSGGGSAEGDHVEKTDSSEKADSPEGEKEKD